jgi:hypothetical protein
MTAPRATPPPDADRPAVSRDAAPSPDPPRSRDPAAPPLDAPPLDTPRSREPAAPPAAPPLDAPRSRDPAAPPPAAPPLDPAAPPRDVPPLHLEQLARGELPPERAAAVRARLGGDADARVAALHASDRELLAAHPPAMIAAAIQRRLAPPRRPRAVWIAAPALACAAIAALVLWPGPEGHVPADILAPDPAPDPTSEGVRIKGLEPRLVLHRQVGDVAQELTAPAAASPRDVLQVSYIAAGAAHGVILSLDGNGLVTLHHPAGIADSTALRQDGAVRLPQAYELDDAPRFERFVFITADAPLRVDQLLTAARELTVDPAHAPLTVPAGARQTSFLVEKPGP